MIGGFANFIDKTKPEIQVYPAPQSRLMTVFLESKFAGIITLKNKDNGNDDDKKDALPNISVVRSYCKTNEIKNLTYDEQNDKLIIEYKGDKKTEELTNLSDELAQIKSYLLKNGKLNGKKRMLDEADWEDSHNKTQTEKTS
jgi:hypothetical protein